MQKTIDTGQNPSQIDEQVQRFMETYTDLRKVMGAGFKHARQHGFSATQLMVLGLIEKALSADCEACTISSLAGELGIEPATVVRTVDNLEKRGLVERRRSQQDRRQVFVEFTDMGRAARAAQQQMFINHISMIFRTMSADGRASLLDGLAEFARAGKEVLAAYTEQKGESKVSVS